MTGRSKHCAYVGHGRLRRTAVRLSKSLPRTAIRAHTDPIRSRSSGVTRATVISCSASCLPRRRLAGVPFLPAAITRMTTSISRSGSSAATAAPTSVPIIAGVPFLRLRRPGRSPSESFMKDICLAHRPGDRLREYGISGNARFGRRHTTQEPQYCTSHWLGAAASSPATTPTPMASNREQDKAGNIGFDAHLFNNRVEVIADAYRKTITNLILPASGPSYLGGYLSGGYGGQAGWVDSKTAAASMRNKDIEASPSTRSTSIRRTSSGRRVSTSLSTAIRSPSSMPRSIPSTTLTTTAARRSS